MLTQGQAAPDFTLNDKDGVPVTLSSFRGRRVVLYFYPKDMTPGCTRQELEQLTERELLVEIARQQPDLDAVVIGVSRDSEASHRRFAEKNSLPFILLSDPERAAIEAFGVWQEKRNYGKVTMGVVRSTFVIGPDGVIEKVIPNAKPDTNAGEILAYLRG